MNRTLKKLLLYLLSLLMLSAVAIFVYDLMSMHLIHMKKVSVFCDDASENVGITNTRSLEALKLYVNRPDQFEILEPYKRENFFNDSLHIMPCSKGLQFSKRYNGARSVIMEVEEKEIVLTVLTRHIRSDE